ncbi:MAG: polysaccharide pyruvyl transferase family protein [Bacteroidales bacterium]|nr:polysaccharide pyruvyl transferase family protein [Bacteroidales bacterium]
MKIGILTYHRACNFGANLQALSTCNYLRNHGYEPLFINWETTLQERINKWKTPERELEEFSKFRNEHFPMTRLCRTDDDIVSVIKEYDIKAVIVGSDAVLQIHPFLSRINFPCRKIITISKPRLDVSCPNPFWGSFYAKLERKLPFCLMSVSSQNSPYKSALSKEKKMARKMLGQFDYISTRDDWTSKMVAYLTDGAKVPTVTPDPVFAFNLNVAAQPTKEDVMRRFKLPEKYALFCFHNNRTVSQKWLSEMQGKMELRGVECVALPFPEGIGFRHPFSKQVDLPLSPLDWYALIKYATYYIGGNMHPIVIALHNAVPCFSFDHYGIVRFRYFVNRESSKIYHILKSFGLAENMVSISGRGYREPSVEHVLGKLDSFDVEAVRAKGKNYLQRYQDMMKNIDELFLKSL